MRYCGIYKDIMGNKLIVLLNLKTGKIEYKGIKK